MTASENSEMSSMKRRATVLLTATLASAMTATTAAQEPVFTIPFHIDQVDRNRLQIREVRLFTSHNSGVAWQQIASAFPDEQHFCFRSDGRRRILVLGP